MRIFVALVMVGLVASFPHASYVPLEVTQPSEKEWVKGLVKDFWESALNPNTLQGTPCGLLSPQLAESLNRAYKSAASGVSNIVGHYQGGKASITSVEWAPNQKEVVVKGVLSVEKENAEYTLRLTHDQGGIWSVRFISITEKVPKK